MPSYHNDSVNQAMFERSQVLAEKLGLQIPHDGTIREAFWMVPVLEELLREIDELRTEVRNLNPGWSPE